MRLLRYIMAALGFASLSAIALFLKLCFDYALSMILSKRSAWGQLLGRPLFAPEFDALRKCVERRPAASPHKRSILPIPRTRAWATSCPRCPPGLWLFSRFFCHFAATQHAVNLTGEGSRQLFLQIADNHFHGCPGHLFGKTGLLRDQLDQLVQCSHLLSLCEVCYLSAGWQNALSLTCPL